MTGRKENIHVKRTTLEHVTYEDGLMWIITSYGSVNTG